MSLTYSEEFNTYFKVEGNLEQYLEMNGKDIYRSGTVELIEHTNDITGERFTLRMDVFDDFKTPNFHVKGNTDDDYLEEFRSFLEALEDFVSVTKCKDAMYTSKRL